MIEFKAGLHYLTRDGRSKGPLEPAGDGPFLWLVRVGDVPDTFYYENGRTSLSEDSPDDLVAEDVMKNLGVEADYTSIEARILAQGFKVEQPAPLRSAPFTMNKPSAAPAEPVGRKDDMGKDRLDLIAPEMLFGIARVLDFGARKYAERNWEHGMKWGRWFGAMMRHMWAWWGGAGPTTKNFLFGDLDSETGFSHLWHAGCCLMVLIAYEERRTGTDDRWREPQK